MNKLAVTFSVLALAAAGCTTIETPTPQARAQGATVLTQQVAYQPGTGVVQNVFPAPAPVSAVAGSSATTNRPEPPVGTEANASGRLNRLAIRMDRDGKMQYVDTNSMEFQRGMRVELTPDHLIRKLQ
jgi:hypothetical protein